MAKSMLAFVAYSSHDEQVAKIIAEAVGRANSKSPTVHYEPWEFNDISGRALISPIIERIAVSSFVVADITYLNPNVVYEIGFAIGSGKRVFLVRHSETAGDKAMAQEAGIFDTLGYKEYADMVGLWQMLVGHIDAEPLAISAALDRLTPVYVIEPPTIDQAATTMTSRIKKARYRYRSFNPAEDTRLAATDAIPQVAASAGVLVSLLQHTNHDGAVHNVRSLFVAGLSHALGKPTLILCPKDYAPPLDVRDEVKRYRSAEEIAEHIHQLSLEITEYLQQADPAPIDAGTLLQSLSIGDPTAENEMATLAKYYLRLPAFPATLRCEGID